MDLSSILAATNNFSEACKLGEGGFGPVYKGVLSDGTEVAVKRLSKKSRQGSRELRNEVELVTKLQHRNVVRLLGCCVERDEKLLIYEYLPNRSLDGFLFDRRKRSELDWKARQNIILRVARGLLYLHEDSSLRVLHRDLKASNVLLDANMNPKISDFGAAITFEEERPELCSRRLVGTLGYIAPECVDGIFSVKSDVFSFGVLMLEILSGQKNLQGYEQILLRQAWTLWNEDRAVEFMDPVLGGSYTAEEAQRRLHVGLLCVQEKPRARPAMSDVVLMLMSDQTQLKAPTEPPSLTRLKRASLLELLAMESGSSRPQSVNDVTISILEPR